MFNDVIEVRLVQPLRAPYSILVTELPIVIEVRPVQLRKDRFPMLVTESGIVTEVRLVQPLKARFPIVVTELGIITLLPIIVISAPIKVVLVPSVYKNPLSKRLDVALVDPF